MDERSSRDRKRLAANREHQHVTLEQHADLVTLITETKDGLEEFVGIKLQVVDAKIDALPEVFDAKVETLKWKMWAALAGGQVAAGTVAALITRTTPADVGQHALAAFRVVVGY